MLLKKVSRRLGALLLGLCLLIGLASPAGAQTFPDRVGIGAAPNEEYIDLYYNLGQPIAPIVFPEATGGSGTLSYSLDGGFASLGFAFNAATRTLSGTPTLAGAGPGGDGFQLTYAVGQESGSGFDTITVYVTVCEGTGTPSGTTSCTAPALTAIAIPSVTVPTYTAGTAITPLVLSAATGGTGSSPLLLYSLTNIPAGLNFNSNTRTLSGMPTEAGDYMPTYGARDAATNSQASQSITIIVSLGSTALPVVANQTYLKDIAITDLVLPEATGVPTDVSLPVTYALTGPGGAALPDGLSFDPDTRTLSGTPTVAGETDLTYTVTDANGASSVAFTVTVNAAEAGFADLNTVILPELARAMTDQTVSAVTQRIDQARSGGSARSSLLPDSPHWQGRHLPTGRPSPTAG